MSKTKVLVTGGEGFVGFYLCQKLNQLGHSVISLDMNLAGVEDRRINGLSIYREIQKILVFC